MIRSCVFSDELSLDFEEVVRICAELRVGYVEPRNVWDTSINRIDLDGARKMQKIMDRFGVRVGVIGSNFGKCSLEDGDEWRKHLGTLDRQVEFCDLFGTRIIRCFPFWVPQGIDHRNGERPNLEEHLPRIAEPV